MIPQVIWNAGEPKGEAIMRVRSREAQHDHSDNYRGHTMDVSRLPHLMA